LLILAKTAYVPGENAVISATVTNNSSRVINLIRVRLRRELTIIASGSREHANLDVSQNDVPVNIVSGQNQSINVTLPVPAGIQHSLNARLIQCSYFLVVQGVTDGLCVGNITVRLPIRSGCLFCDRSALSFSESTHRSPWFPSGKPPSHPASLPLSIR
jgi:hypothetical protein